MPPETDNPFASLLKIAGYDPETVSALGGQRSQLLDERSALTRQMLDPQEASPGGAFGRFLAAALPVAIAGAVGGKRAAGFAAGPAAEALTLGQQMDRLDRKEKRENYAFQREDLDSQIKSVDAQLAGQREIQADIGKEVIKNEMGKERDEFKAGLDLQRDQHKLAASHAFQLQRLSVQDANARARLAEAEKSYMRRTEHLYDLKAELEGKKATAKNEQGKKPRQVSEDVALEMGDADSASSAIQNINKQHGVLREGIIGSVTDSKIGKKVGEFFSTGASRGASSLASSITRGLWQTDELLYSDSVKKAAQVVGRYLEGGKLSNADYEDKYVHFFPKTFDNKDTATAKLKMLQDMLKERRKARLTNLGNAGFDVSPWMEGLRASHRVEPDTKDPSNYVIINGVRTRVVD